MDIILNTTFGNPNLPQIQRAGLLDTFNRNADDTLGVSDDGKRWETHSWGNEWSTWGPTGNGTAQMKASSGGFHLALVDVLRADGLLEATYAGRGDSDSPRNGIVFRARDARNYLYWGATSESNEGVAFAGRVNGEQYSRTRQDTSFQPGDRVAIELDGATITAYLNDEYVIRLGDDFSGSPIPTNTKVGFYAFEGARGEWSQIRFTPSVM